MGNYFTGCCPTGPVPFYGSPVLYSYNTGRIDGADRSGVAKFVSPQQQLSAGVGKSSIAFNGTVDDLAVIIPAGVAVTASYNATSGIETVVLPPKYLILGANSGSYDVTLAVSDGTHSLSAAGDYNAINAAFVAAGFNLALVGAAIPLSTLQAIGVSDAGGNLNFQFVLFPSGVGNITITSAVAA